MYYEINEYLARTAHELGHFDEYVENSATESYRTSVDCIVEIARQQKALVRPRYHDQIDRMADRYSKKLADFINRGNSIDAYYPSSLVTGRSGRSKKKSDAQYNMRRNQYERQKKLDELKEQIKTFSERNGVRL